MTNLPGEKTQTRTGLERQKRQPGGSGKVGMCNTVERVHLLLLAWLFRTQKSETAKWQKMIFLKNSTILTLDVEVLRVALSVSLHVGRDAVVQPCPGARHALQHQGVVPHQDPAGHVLVHKLALRKDANAIYNSGVLIKRESSCGLKVPRVCQNSLGKLFTPSFQENCSHENMRFEGVSFSTEFSLFPSLYSFPLDPLRAFAATDGASERAPGSVPFSPFTLSSSSIGLPSPMCRNTSVGGWRVRIH